MFALELRWSRTIFIARPHQLTTSRCRVRCLAEGTADEPSVPIIASSTVPPSSIIVAGRYPLQQISPPRRASVAERAVSRSMVTRVPGIRALRTSPAARGSALVETVPELCDWRRLCLQGHASPPILPAVPVSAATPAAAPFPSRRQWAL